ncbi:MAG: SH3 domain-containing protein [Limisphaerales bacterium]
MNFWLLCGMMVSTALLAQQATNLPGTKTIEEPAPAPAATNAAGPGAETPSALGAAASTNAPAAKAAKKKSAKKKSPKKIGSKAAPRTAPVGRVELRTVPLVAGPAVVVANSVNVRAQARLHSEVIGRLTRGQPVTVIGEITLNNSAADEPSAWAKITLPPGTHAWVKSTYIDPTDKTVKATRLNLRAGPGENYSVLGSLEHGQTVKDLSAKGDWMEIEPPANAFAFVAAQFLKQEEAAAAAAPAAAGTAVTPAPPLAATAPPPVEPPALTPPAPAPEVATPTNTAGAATAPAPGTAVQEPLPPRIISHEGFVRGMTSIQAPTYFELASPENGKAIDYLYTTSKELDLRRYKGLRVVVTGEEGLDERWGHTPVLTIEKIEVLSEPPRVTDVPSSSPAR